jgi:hypothetical protein
VSDFETCQCTNKILVKKLKGRDHAEDLSVEGRIILERSRCGLDSSGSGEGPVARSCGRGNEPSGCIRRGEFLTS